MYRKILRKYKSAKRLSEIISNFPNKYSDLLYAMGKLDDKIEELSSRIYHDKNDVKLYLNNIIQNTNLISSTRSVGNKVKVVFLVHHIEAWDSLADVYEKMLLSDDFEPLVASINRRFPGEDVYGFEPTIHEKLQKSGVAHLRLGMQNSFEALDILKALAPDIIFRQSQWDNDIPPAFSTNALRFARLCYVPYEVLHMLRTQDIGNSDRDIVSDTDWHRSCWRIFYATDLDVKRISETSARQDQNVFATGHPKIARLIRQGRENKFWPINNSNIDAAKIIWSPHHSIGSDWNNFGMFNSVYREMLNWAKSDNKVEIVFSQHPALLPRLGMDNSGISKEDLASFLDEWDSLPNTGGWTAGNYAGLMEASDYLISDGLSFLMEYQFFNKPVLFLERDDHVAFSQSGEKVIQGTYRLKTLEDAKTLISSLHSGGVDHLAPKRIETLKWLYGEGNAVDNILDSIRKGIKEEKGPRYL